MTKQILFIQGGGEGAHDHWDDKLVASLARELGPGYEIRYPRMPNEADPSYEAWKTAITDAMAELTEEALLVGHSIGATILIHAIAEEPPRRQLAGVFLVAAPFVGPGGWPSDDIEPSSDLGQRLPKSMPIYLYHGSDDETAPAAHVDLYERAIPLARVRKLEGRDHQLNSDLSEVARDISSLGRDRSDRR